MTLMTEEELIDSAKSGDVDSFNQLIYTYERLAYSVAHRTLRNPDLAADAVQNGFVKAFRGLNGFRGGNFRAWLMRIVTNCCYDILRAEKRRPTESLDHLLSGVEHLPYLTDPQESPEQYTSRMELGNLIETGIGTLPADQRVVIVLRDVHGYTYQEIADITQDAMGTVKSRLSRARGGLRDYLQQHSELLPETYRHKDASL